MDTQDTVGPVADVLVAPKRAKRARPDPQSAGYVPDQIVEPGVWMACMAYEGKYSELATPVITDFLLTGDDPPYWIVKADEFLFDGMTQLRVVVMHGVAPYLDPAPISSDPVIDENRIYFDPQLSQAIDVSTLICRVSAPLRSMLTAPPHCTAVCADMC